MKIKLDYDELEGATKVINDDKEALNVEITRLLESLERLKNCWYGDDFDQFYNKAYEYINRMRVLTGYMEVTSEFINKSTNSYRQQDISFAEDLHKEVELLDEQDYS